MQQCTVGSKLDVLLSCKYKVGKKCCILFCALGLGSSWGNSFPLMHTHYIVHCTRLSLSVHSYHPISTYMYMENMCIAHVHVYRSVSKASLKTQSTTCHGCESHQFRRKVLLGDANIIPRLSPLPHNGFVLHMTQQNLCTMTIFVLRITKFYFTYIIMFSIENQFHWI